MNRDREIAERLRLFAKGASRLGGEPELGLDQAEWFRTLHDVLSEAADALTAASAGHQAEVEKARREENEGCQESVKRYLNNIDVWPSEPPQSKAALNALVDIKGRIVLRPLNNGSARLTVQEAGEG